MAHIEALLAAARDSALRPDVGAAIEQAEATSRLLLATTRAPTAERAARATAALVDGFALRHLAHPRPDDEDELTRALIALVVAYTMDETEPGQWRDWLAAAPPRRRPPVT